MDARMRALHRQFTCRDTWYQKKMHCRCRARYTCTCRGRHRHPQKRLLRHVSPKRLFGHACLPKKATWSCMSPQKGYLVMHVSPKRLLGHACLTQRCIKSGTDPPLDLSGPLRSRTKGKHTQLQPPRLLPGGAVPSACTTASPLGVRTNR